MPRYVPGRSAFWYADGDWWGDDTTITPGWELASLPADVQATVSNRAIRTFLGTAGNDVLRFDAAGAVPFVLVGLAGDDILVDTDYGLHPTWPNGHDAALLGGAGNDWIDASDGNDTLAGGTGDDTLYGGPGTNRLYGDAGNDLLDASVGPWSNFWWNRPQLPGGPAAWAGIEARTPDTLDGGGGCDTLIGSRAGDLLDGGTGEDALDGLDGADTLYGGSGYDTLVGGGHDDLLDGGADADLLSGGLGDDMLVGGAGDDTLDGGNGADALLGGDGDDRLLGGRGADWINTGAGNDTVDAGTGNDFILLGDGDDVVLARDAHGLGDDAIDGGAGNDRIHGGYGADTIAGGLGNDTLNGGAGNDTLTGGAGADVFEIRGAYGRETITDFSRAEGDRVKIEAGLYGIEDSLRPLLARTYIWEDSVVIRLDPAGQDLLTFEGLSTDGEILALFDGSITFL